jgi:hypothetical protein
LLPSTNGTRLKSEDHLRAFAFRYQYRFGGDWFVGVQGVNTNYEILGQTALDNEMLQTLGLTGFSGSGIGANVNLDSRDSEYSPHKGWLINLNNIAYRAFVGVGCLYGGGLSCTDDKDVYPDAGAGVQYVIKEKEGMVLNLEYAKGKGDNEGVILKFGYGF